MKREISDIERSILVDSLIVYVRGRAVGDINFRQAFLGTALSIPSSALRLTVETFIKSNKELVYRGDLHRPLITIISAEIAKVIEVTRACVEDNKRERIEHEAVRVAETIDLIEKKVSRRRARVFAWSIYDNFCCGSSMKPHEAYYATALIANAIWESVRLQVVEEGISELYREIHFPPEHQQAGIGILSYFSTILLQKLPNSDASISISQDKNKVTLKIKHKDGKEEQISHLLQEYGMVVVGKMAAEQFLPDPMQAMALKQKLEMAEMEVRHTRDLLYLEKSHSERRFSTLEAEIIFLKQQLVDQLKLTRDDRRDLLGVLSSALGSDISARQLEIIQQLINGIIDKNQQVLKASAEKLMLENPTLLEKVQVFLLQSSTSSILGNSIYDWLKTVWVISPK